MATFSTPYLSGIVTSATATVITAAGSSFTDDVIGRCVRIQSSVTTRNGQIRKIVGRTSTTLTLQYAWNSGVATSDPDYEAIPQNGDTFVISFFLDDLDNGVDIIKVDSINNKIYRFAAANTFENEVFVYDTDCFIDFRNAGIGNSEALLVRTGACFRFGDVLASGQTTRGCKIFITESRGGYRDLFQPSASLTRCDLHLYECSITLNSNGTSYPFMRLNFSPDSITRFIDCDIIGDISSRIRGSRTYLKSVKYNANFSDVGTFTVQAPIGFLRNVSAFNCFQGFYWFYESSGSGDVKGLNASSITTRLLRLAYNTNGSTPLRLRLINTYYDNSATSFIVWDNSGFANLTPSYTCEWCYSVSIQIFQGDSLSGGGRVWIRDAVGAVIFNAVSTDGTIPEQILRVREYLRPVNATTSPLSAAYNSGSLYAPYTVRFREYGFSFQSLTIGEIDYTNPTVVNGLNYSFSKIQNVFVTSNKASVDALSGFSFDHGTETLSLSGSNSIQNINNRCVSYLVDNPQIDDFIDYEGNTLSFNWHMVVSSPASITGLQVVAIAAGRNLTLNSVGDYSATVFTVGSTSTITVTPGGVTDLRAWTIPSGATINRSSTGSAPVYVSSLTGITAGAGVTLQLAPPVITIAGFQPLSDVVISQAGRTLDRLNATSPPFTWNATGITIPSAVSLTVIKSGFEIYTQTIQVTSSNQTITVAQIPAGATDTFNGPEFKFKSLMISDAGFKRILAAATGALVDDAANCRLAQFEAASVKTSWNLLVAATVPTAPEITAWQGYLASAGYSAIAFSNGSGEVS